MVKKMWLAGTTAVFCICFGSNLSQAEDSKYPLIEFASPSPAPVKLIAIASDGKQQVWAIAQKQGAVLYHLQKGKWASVPLKKFPTEVTPLALKRNKDGDLIGFWREDTGKNIFVLSKHSGTTHSVLARIKAKLNDPVLLPLRNGGALVTESGPRVLRVKRGGGDPSVNVLEESSFVAPKKKDDGSVGTDYVPIRAFEDHHGTLWLWSHSMKTSEHLWRLRHPFLVTRDGQTFLTLPQVKIGGPISLITARTPDIVSIAAPEVGLFDSNIVTDEHSRSREDEMKFIENIFSAGGNGYLISTPRPSETHVEMSKTLKSHLEVRVKNYYDPEKRTSSLLKFQEGKLKLITKKFDGKPKFGWLDRPVVEQKDGFWTCINEGGLAFVSYADGKEPVRLNWRNGLPLKHPTQLVRAENDHLVALDRRSGSACLVPSKRASKPPGKPLRIDILKTYSLLIEDHKGGIQGMLRNRRFAQWKNGKWEDWSVPEKFKGIENFHLGQTDRKQIWILPTDAGSAGVYDVDTQKWKVFKDISAALASQIKPGQRMEMGDFPSLAPFSSANDPPKIAFVSQAGAIAYFDQKSWKYWQIPEIAGPDARITATSYFRNDGTLIAPINNRLWELKNGKNWVKTENSGEHAEASYRRQSTEPPENCPVKNVRTTVYDKHGVCWLQDKNGGIWKSIPGYAVPLLSESDPNPILTGATFYGICTDNIGNAFIRLHFGGGAGRYLSIASREPVIKTDVKLKEVKGDLVTFKLGTAPWHRWRMDKGEWALMESQKEFQIEGLLPGDHELEIIAFNGELTPAKKSMTLPFAITSLNESSLNQLISQLEKGDLDAKENATQQLRSQGPSILPRLKAATSSDNENFVWWLKAVIQRIEEDSPAK